MIALWEKQIVPAFPDYDFREDYHADCTQGYCLTSEKARTGGSCSFPSAFAPGKPGQVQPGPPAVPRRWALGARIALQSYLVAGPLLDGRGYQCVVTVIMTSIC